MIFAISWQLTIVMLDPNGCDAPKHKACASAPSPDQKAFRSINFFSQSVRGTFVSA
jgi:hypothetical protein